MLKRRDLHEMKVTLISLFKKPRNIFLYFFLSFSFFTLFKIIPVYHILRDFYKIPGISFSRRISVFYDYVYRSCEYHLWNSRLITITLAFLTALNIFLFIAYARRQGSFLKATHSSFFASIWGIFLGFFGIGCISCGAFILAPLITFLGLGTYMNVFTEHASFISFLGIIFVFISNIYLLRQLSKPIVCKV